MMSSIIQDLLIVSSNTKSRHGSRNCSMMSSDEQHGTRTANREQ
jgi:hypothetical protein